MNEDCPSEAPAIEQSTPEQKQRPVLTPTPEEREQWVKRYRESGLSLRAFSKQQDIPPMSLWRWARAASEQNAPTGQPPATGFAELKLPVGFTNAAWAVELSLPNGTVLRMSKDTPPALVEQLLRVC